MVPKKSADSQRLLRTEESGAHEVVPSTLVAGVLGWVSTDAGVSGLLAVEAGVLGLLNGLGILSSSSSSS